MLRNVDGQLNNYLSTLSNIAQEQRSRYLRSFLWGKTAVARSWPFTCIHCQG